MALTRREVLWLGAGALFLLTGEAASAAELQGLDQFGIAGPPCDAVAKTTPGVAREATFKAGSPARASLGEAGDRGVGLVLTGTVSGVTCGRIKGARVDFWQANERGVYDMTGFRFRGHQLTDTDGGYRLRTIIPGRVRDGRARHIGVNIIVAGKADFWTEVFFPDDPADARDPRFNTALVVKMPPGRPESTSRTATFDFVLNL
ncbi:MAG: dioxygenase [Vicinamibacterales bacterium]